MEAGPISEITQGLDDPASSHVGFIDEEESAHAKLTTPTVQGEETAAAPAIASPQLVDDPPYKSQDFSATGKRQSIVTVPDGMERTNLAEDIYSIMFLAGPDSAAFWLSLAVFALQLTIMCLIVSDLLRSASDDNPVKIPIAVPSHVAFAQYITVVLAVICQDDMFTSLSNLAFVEFDGSLKDRFPYATHLKWVLSNALRLVEGYFTFIISFLFVIQSKDVLSIFLNFAALQYISELDNITFRLGQSGYLGPAVNELANCVPLIELPMRTKGRRYMGWASFLSSILALIFGLSFVKSRQLNGYYLESESSRSLLINFGDEVYRIPPSTAFEFNNETGRRISIDLSQPPDLHYAFFSGVYEPKTWGWKIYRLGDRPVFFERDPDSCMDDPACGRFYYCKSVQAWVFTIPALGDATKERDLCKWGWLLQSPKTAAYKLEDVPTSNWKIWTGVIQTANLFSISDIECSRNSDCSLNGKCIDKRCNCDSGWQGISCEVPSPYCQHIMWIEHGQSADDFFIYGPYSPVLGTDGEQLLVYERPVYRSLLSDEVSSELVFYSGRRWYDTVWSAELAKTVFDPDFHAYWDDVLEGATYWISETTESKTGLGVKLIELSPSESVGNFGPYGHTIPLEATFECLDVNCDTEDLMCGVYGTCIEFDLDELCTLPNLHCETELTDRDRDLFATYHECRCHSDFGGQFCEFDPIGPYASTPYEAYYERCNGKNCSPASLYEYLYWSNATFESIDQIQLDNFVDEL